MDLYQIWFNAKPGVRDLDLTAAAKTYLEHLTAAGLIAGWRLTRAKLGFGHHALGEWNITIEVRDLAQLEAAFTQVARRSGATEVAHHGLNSLACDLSFGLYRDFPDPMRETGEERF